MHSKANYIPAADMCKYYSRPLDIKNKPVQDIESDSDSDHGIFLLEDSDTEQNIPKFLNASTQTDYRESETQTYPWDPPFYVNRAKNLPEVLSLKDLTYGNGLPVTETELKYIIRKRRNQSLGTSLEGSGDFVEEKKLIKKEIENDWNYKISKHKEKQLEKLKKMKTAIAAELLKQSEKKEILLKNMWNHKKDHLTKMNSKFQNDLTKEINILEQKLKWDSENLKGKARKSATISRELYFSDQSKKTFQVEMSHLFSKYYSNPNGLTRVSKWLEKKKSELYNEVPLAKPVHKDEREKLAELAYKDLLEKKRTKMPPKVYREDYDKEEESIESSVKGEVEFDILELPEEGVDLVTVFQQVLKGRAYQKQMLELIEKHKDALDLLLV